jgi:hypothetical protein
LCNKNVGSLKFDYYKKDFGHLMDKSLFSILENYKHNVFFDRDITPVAIGSGQVLRDDFKYVYFPGGEVIDEENLFLKKISSEISYLAKLNSRMMHLNMIFFRLTTHC